MANSMIRCCVMGQARMGAQNGIFESCLKMELLKHHELESYHDCIHIYCHADGTRDAYHGIICHISHMSIFNRNCGSFSRYVASVGIIGAAYNTDSAPITP